MPQRLSAYQWALLAPGAVLLLGLLVAPIALMAVESFHPFVGGRVGAGAGWTLRNYTELIEPAYAFYFYDTFRIGFIVSAIALLLATPLAWTAARTKRRAVRVSIFGLLIGLLFMSLVARLYAIQMTWGSNGPLAFFGLLIGWSVIDTIDTWIKGREYFAALGATAMIFNVVLALCGVVGMMTRRGPVQAVIAVGQLAYLVSGVLRLFNMVNLAV